MVQDAAPIGEVQEIKGNATVTRVDGTKEPLETGSPIYQGDTVHTDAEGAVNIAFVDDSTFAVSKDADLKIDNFVFNEGTTDSKTEFSVLRGIFVYQSGEVGQADPDDVSINTPIGSIGIRGTTIAGEIQEEGSDVPSTVTLVDGSIVVRTEAGETLLDQQYETVELTGITQPATNVGVIGADALNDTYNVLRSVAPNFFSTLDQSSENQSESNTPEAVAAQEGEAAEEAAVAEDAAEGEVTAEQQTIIQTVEAGEALQDITEEPAAEKPAAVQQEIRTAQANTPPVNAAPIIADTTPPFRPDIIEPVITVTEPPVDDNDGDGDGGVIVSPPPPAPPPPAPPPPAPPPPAPPPPAPPPPPAAFEFDVNINSFNENTSGGTIIGQIVGVNGTNLTGVTFALAHHGLYNALPLTIDANGNIIVQTNNLFNHEQLPEIELNITATRGGDAFTFTHTLNINDVNEAIVAGAPLPIHDPTGGGVYELAGAPNQITTLDLNFYFKDLDTNPDFNTLTFDVLSTAAGIYPLTQVAPGATLTPGQYYIQPDGILMIKWPTGLSNSLVELNIRAEDGGGFSLDQTFTFKIFTTNIVTDLANWVPDGTAGQTYLGNDGSTTLVVGGTNSNATGYMRGGDDTVNIYGDGATIFAGDGQDTVIIGADAENASVYGGDGNDLITDAGISNRLHGGMGNDTMTLSEAAVVSLTNDSASTHVRIDGGMGYDMLHLQTSTTPGNIDFRNLNDNLIKNIEGLDISVGSNNIVLNFSDILAMVEPGANKFYINMGDNDALTIHGFNGTVDLANAGAPEQTIGGVDYQAFSDGTFTLYIADTANPANVVVTGGP